MLQELKEMWRSQNNILQRRNNNKKKENLKTNQEEILELKSTVSEKFTGGNQRQIWAGLKEESLNLKLGEQKLLSLRNRKKNALSEQNIRDHEVD